MKTTNRTFGKLLALALVVLFALTAVVPVLAEPVEQDNLQVVIHNNEGLPAMTENQFTVYQLFTGSPFKEGGIPEGDVSDAGEWGAENWNNYTLADIEWGASVVGEKDGVKYDHSEDLLKELQALTADADAWAFADGANVFAEVGTAEELARVLEAHKTNAFLQHFAKIVADKGGLEPIDGKCEVTSDKENPENDYLTFAFDKAGYYLFVEADKSEPDEQDATSEYILAVLGDQEINLKASVPTVDKDIVDSANTDKGDVAGVSDYVQFKLTGTLPKNYGDFDTYKYAFHDTLSNGLTLVGPDAEHPLVVRVYANKAAADADTDLKGGTVLESTNYSVVKDGLEDGCTLEVKFTDLKTLKNDGAEITVTKDSIFVVTYYAQVNENAVIGVAGNPNTVDLEFSNDPNHDGTGRTQEKKVYVYAFGLDLVKVASDKLDDGDDDNDGLPGAGFVLKNAAGNYAIFKDQYVLTVTTTVTEGAESTTTKTQTFYETKEAAEAAKTDAEKANSDTTTVEAVVDSIRRLTGWTSETSDPSTEEVTVLIGKYDEAKEAFDDAKKADREEGGTAYNALEEAKAALEAYLLESGETGEIPDVYGLDEGKYTLKEVITPDGYNTMDEFVFVIQAETDENGALVRVTYSAEGKPGIVYDNFGNDQIPNTAAKGVFSSGLLPDTLINQKAPFLPFTGGTGTMIFYILGAVLIAGAVTYLVIAAKRRKKAE